MALQEMPCGEDQAGREGYRESEEACCPEAWTPQAEEGDSFPTFSEDPEGRQAFIRMRAGMYPHSIYIIEGSCRYV